MFVMFAEPGEFMIFVFSPRNEIDSLMAKYVGQEHTMYLKICKKYNVQPEPEISAGGKAILSRFFGMSSLPVSLLRVVCSRPRPTPSAAGAAGAAGAFRLWWRQLWWPLWIPQRRVWGTGLFIFAVWWCHVLYVSVAIWRWGKRGETRFAWKIGKMDC